MVTHSMKGLKVKDLTKMKTSLNLQPSYQRNEVWKVKQIREFLNHVFAFGSIPTVALRQVRNKYEVIDGQQRLSTILKVLGAHPKETIAFPEGVAFLEENLGGKYLSDISDKSRARFENASVTASIYSNLSDEEAVGMFLNYQKGMKLKVPEKIFAIESTVTDLCFEYARHPFWCAVHSDKKRRQVEHLISMILYHESQPMAMSLNEPILEGFVRTYIGRPFPDKYVKNLKNTLDIGYNIFGDSETKLLSQTATMSLYMIINHLHPKYLNLNLTNSHILLRKWLEPNMRRINANLRVISIRSAGTKMAQRKQFIEEYIDISTLLETK